MTISRASAALSTIAAIAILLTATGDARQADPGVQLRAAIEKEDVAGDLEGAMVLYRQIIAANGRNRSVTAKAILRLAGCHEKLGQTEARKLYERLVAEYSDQAAEAASARQKLARLLAASGAEPSKPAFRKITIPGEISPGAQLSADGARLAMVSGGDVWVVNLQGKVAPGIAGGAERLSPHAKASWTGLTWSRDGQWIAFNEDAIPTRNIYVLPVSGEAPRKVPRGVPLLGGGPWYLALSSEGGRLAYSTTLEGRMVLHMVAVATGKTVAQFGNPYAVEPRFSPDDTRVAYIRFDKSADDGRLGLAEVRVARPAEQSDLPVTKTPGLFRSPAWSPNGTLLAFLAHPDKKDRTVEEIWIVPVPETAGALGEPLRMRLPSVAASIAGWTADNKIGLLCTSPYHNAIYTVPLSGGKATQVSAEGYTYNPQWSPDGERIFFRWGIGDIASVPANGGTISVVPRTGEKISVSLPNGGNHISPDGSRIVWAGGRDRITGVHLWTVPVSGGEPVRLPMKPDLDSFQPRWSPDGRWIAFDSERDVTGDRKLDENVFVVSSEGGEPRQITSHTDCFCELLAWSPGGDRIAYACSDQVIRIVPFAGGEPRTVLKADGLRTPGNSLEWTRDGSRLVYSAKGRLWTVPISGGEPTPISTDLDGNIQQFALSPDGKRIAFNAPSGGDLELWLMEDFIHLVKAAR